GSPGSGSRTPTEEIPMSRPIIRTLAVVAFALGSAALAADEPKDELGTVRLFNGKDLTGWGYKTGEKFDGKKESSDGRYTAKDGVLVVNPGKGIKQLWTTATFPND